MLAMVGLRPHRLVAAGPVLALLRRSTRGGILRQRVAIDIQTVVAERLVFGRQVVLSAIGAGAAPACSDRLSHAPLAEAQSVGRRLRRGGAEHAGAGSSALDLRGLGYCFSDFPGDPVVRRMDGEITERHDAHQALVPIEDDQPP
jgi:hypothetical protein